MARRLTRNAIRCNLCGDVVESTSVHDKWLCGCGQTGVGSGLKYARRLGWGGTVQSLGCYAACTRCRPEPGAGSNSRPRSVPKARL